MEEGKTKIKAEIVGHSLSPQGDELISVLCTFPRIILAEVNTHRMLSKNTSSSRAIPFKKMVEAVQENPFIPIAWQKEHKGMQGSEYHVDRKHENAVYEWLKARDYAVKQASMMNNDGITKQLCNRLLEPFMWTTMLITGSREGWDNFFNLRCPQYSWQNEGNFKSWKDLVKFHFNNGASRNWIDELEQTTTLKRLQNNKGQAEIHMMTLAESIYDAVNESTPKQLQVGEWHVPFYNKIYPIVEKVFKDIPDNECWNSDFNEKMIAISTAMSARTSYTIVGNEKEIEYKKMVELHDRLLSQDPPHSSPFEHCARAMSDEEYTSFIKGQYPMFKDDWGIGNHETYLFKTKKMYEGNEENFEPITKDLIPIHGWCNNLKGFIPYRYFIDNNLTF